MNTDLCSNIRDLIVDALVNPNNEEILGFTDVGLALRVEDTDELYGVVIERV